MAQTLDFSKVLGTAPPDTGGAALDFSAVLQPAAASEPPAPEHGGSRTWAIDTSSVGSTLGGIASDALDSLSTLQYGAAGALDAGLAGHNPFAGAVEGVRTKESYTDVLEHHAEWMPDGVRTTVGTLADIFADPALYLTAGVGLVAKGTKVHRALLATDRMLSAPVRKVAELATESHGLANLAAIEHLPAARAALRQLAGREAFAAADVAGKSAAEALGARRAALHARNRFVESALEGWETLAPEERIRRAGVVLAQVGPATSSGSWKYFRQYITSTTARLANDVVKYTPMGPQAAKYLTQVADLEQKLLGEYLGHWKVQEGLLKQLPKTLDSKAAFALVTGTEDEFLKAAPEVQALLAPIRAHLAQIGSDVEELGVRMAHPGLTGMLNALSPAAKQDVLRYFGRWQAEGLSAGLGEELRAAQPGAQEFLRQVEAQFGRAIEIVDDGKGNMVVESYLTRAATGFPQMLSEEGRKALRARPWSSNQAAREAIKKLNLGLTDRELQLFMERFVSAEELGGGDLRKLLPTNYIQLPPEFYETDLRKILPALYSGAAHTLARAQIMGGGNEVEKMLLESARQWAGGTKSGLQSVDRLRELFDMSKGLYGGHSVWKKISGAFDVLSSTLMMGPRVAVLQGVQGANAVATFGFGNMAAAAGAVFKHPELAKMVERSGALLPSAQSLSEGSLAFRKTLDHVMSLTGIKPADQMMRLVSGIAASLRVQEIAADLQKLGMAGLHSAKGQALLKEARTLGLDGMKLLEEGGVLTDQHLADAMMHGANMTQFAGRFLDLPKFSTTIPGRFLWRFKAFATQQHEFLRKTVYEPLLSKNAEERARGLAAAARYGAAYMWAAGKVHPLLNRMTQIQEPDETATTRLTSGLLQGAFGVWADQATMLASGNKWKISHSLLGANYGAAEQTITGLSAMGQDLIDGGPGNVDPMYGQSRQAVPAMVKQYQSLLTSW